MRIKTCSYSIMKNNKLQLVALIEYGLPLAILAILILCTFLKFSQHPYMGFRPDSSGHIQRIFVEQPTPPLLQQGDQLVSIGSWLWSDFQKNLRQPFFAEIIPGNTVDLLIKRDEHQITVPWKFPNLDAQVLERNDLTVNEGWLSFIFWLAGTLTLLVLRPKDEPWRLMVAFNYITALWVAIGSGLSFYHIGEAAILLRIVVWFSVPVYLHLHWVYPKPFPKLSWAAWGGYLIAFVLAVLEWFQRMPTSLYLLGFLVGVSGSVFLLIAHAIWQPQTRRDLRILLIAALLSLIPSMLAGISGVFNNETFRAGAATIGLPFLPLAYFYAAFRRQLGESELRVNRLVAIYIFMIVLGLVLFILAQWADTWINWKEAPIFTEIIAALLTAMISILIFPGFQAFIEKRLLGIRLPPAEFQEESSARIVTSLSSADLQDRIRDEILPSLLVRQFAALQFDEHSAPKVILAVGLEDEQLPNEAERQDLISTAGKYRAPALLKKGQPCPWVRLVLPLKVGDQLTGLWLFGRRDPDDVYSQLEIPTLQSLANQTAIAQSNFLKTEHIKAQNLANISRHEEERQSLALELHDSVLNQIASLTMGSDLPLPPSFQENYDQLIQRVREIIGNLRPPMLNYGLKLALEGLADQLAEHNDTIKITMEVQGNERYPQNIEQHLFRIIQEACSNAIRHAQATNIKISGHLNPEQIELQVEDDGIGFQIKNVSGLDALLVNKHFGLAGMRERGELIGAKVNISSEQNEGTQIQVIWEPSNVDVHEHL